MSLEDYFLPAKEGGWGWGTPGIWPGEFVPPDTPEVVSKGGQKFPWERSVRWGEVHHGCPGGRELLVFRAGVKVHASPPTASRNSKSETDRGQGGQGLRLVWGSHDPDPTTRQWLCNVRLT